MSQPDSKQALHCEDCGAVIPSSAAGGLCVACLLVSVLEDSEDASEEKETVIGGYRLLGRLGEGGAGEVFLAEGGGDLKKKVALKLIHVGRDSEEVVTRFEAERETLARMEHPGIAQVFDAGISEDGRPYFAMEYIDGLPINEFANKYQLVLCERLALFEQVCRAVQHAHLKGVIHRDLKPSNILASRSSEGDRVVVIDFGIALAVDRPVELAELFTRTGEFIGTPAYMSPEQASGRRGAVDTRSDVYALGIILYELLTDRLPFDAEALAASGIAEILRVIQERDAEKPSTRTGRKELRGDLDWIVARSLEKEPTQRYQSPGALADDVHRYLGSEPVEAGPPTARYRVKKFVRRHRIGVAAGSLVLLAVLAGAVVSVIFGLKALRAERLAERRADQGEEIISYLLGDLYERLEPTGRVDALQSAAEQVDAYYDALPEAANADSIRKRARALVNVSKVDRSKLDPINRALALYESAPGTSKLELGEALLEKAFVYRQAKQIPELHATCDAALTLIENEIASPELARLRARVQMSKARAFVLQPNFEDRDFQGSIKWLRLAESNAEKAGDVAKEELIEAKGALAIELMQSGALEEANRYARQSESLAKKLYDANPADVKVARQYILALETMAAAAFTGRDLAGAKVTVERARRMREDLWRSNPKNNDFRYRLGKNLRLVAQVAHVDGDGVNAREYFQLAQLLEIDYVEPALLPIAETNLQNAKFFKDLEDDPNQPYGFKSGTMRRSVSVLPMTFDDVWTLSGVSANLAIPLEVPRALEVLTVDHYAVNLQECHALTGKLTLIFADGTSEEHPFFVRDTRFPAIDAIYRGHLLGPQGETMLNCNLFRQSFAIKNKASVIESFVIEYDKARYDSVLAIVAISGS